MIYYVCEAVLTHTMTPRQLFYAICTAQCICSRSSQVQEASFSSNFVISTPNFSAKTRPNGLFAQMDSFGAKTGRYCVWDLEKRILQSVARLFGSRVFSRSHNLAFLSPKIEKFQNRGISTERGTICNLGGSFIKNP